MSVERASRVIGGTKQQDNEREVKKDAASKVKDASVLSHGYIGSIPIAEKLGVDYPFPPHLEYVYCVLLISDDFCYHISSALLFSSSG